MIDGFGDDPSDAVSNAGDVNGQIFFIRRERRFPQGFIASAKFDKPIWHAPALARQPFGLVNYYQMEPVAQGFGDLVRR